MKTKTTDDTARKDRIAGIGTAARDLRVTRQHLRHVLAGRRTSRRLTRAYQEWQRKHIGA
jgi:hypothetical protein